MSDLPSDGQKIDPELQEFLMLEKQKAQVTAQVSLTLKFHKIQFSLQHKFTSLLDSRIQ